jgi:hypothetical protein
VARALLLVCLPAHAAKAEAQQGSVPPLQSGGEMLPVHDRSWFLTNAPSVPSVAQQAAACMQQPSVAEAALAAATSLARLVLEAAEGGGQGMSLAEVPLAPNLLWVLCGMHTFPFIYGIPPSGHGMQRQDGAPPSYATWELLGALPLLARFENNRCATDRRLAAKAVLGLAAAMPCCGVSSFASCEQVATWMAAAEAVLRLLPLMEAEQPVARQAVEGHQQPEQGAEQVAGDPGAQLELCASILLGNMLSSLWGQTSKAVCQWAASDAVQRDHDEQREAFSALARQLWGLHSACCRAVHWLLRQPEKEWGLHAEDLLQHSEDLLLADLSVQHAAGGAPGAASCDQRCGCRLAVLPLCPNMAMQPLLQCGQPMQPPLSRTASLCPPP